VEDPFSQILLQLEKVQRKGARFVCNNFSVYSSVTGLHHLKPEGTTNVVQMVNVDLCSSLIRDDALTRARTFINNL